MARKLSSVDYDLGLLSAIWILSCNDENEIITYEGLRHRLGLDADFDIKAVVLGSRELFRPGILQWRLDEWKKNMKGKKSLPGWIAEIPSGVKREAAIDNLTRNDVFRNQFRTEYTVDRAPKCSLEIMDWGLQHIDRLRKADVETRQEWWQKFSQIITAGSLIIALSAVVVSWDSVRQQSALKQYEVTLKPKQTAYSDFMAAFDETAVAAFKHDEAKTLGNFTRMETSFYILEPFLDQGTGDKVFSRLNEFRTLCTRMAASSSDVIKDDEDKKAYQQLTIELARLKLFFKTTLFSNLFKEASRK
jgi:hypothetical protein